MERLRVSDNGHYLMTESGQPFFWLGDTAWELFHRCTLEESALYFSNRQQKGFNVVLAVVLAEREGLTTPNVYGELPLHNADPDQPNEAYFRTVDLMIEQAAAHDILLALLPTWGDKVTLAWGPGPVVFNPENARRYGQFLGKRYRDVPNIVWVLGGDRSIGVNGVDETAIWRAMAAGLDEGEGAHRLTTFHPQGQRGSSATLHGETWLDMNMWQSGHIAPDLPIWDWIAADWALKPSKPVLDAEPNYEDHPINPFTRKWEPSFGYFREEDVRKQAYRSVFAGACGHTYGHHSIWQMYSSAHEPVNFPDRAWQDALERPGAAQMGFLRRLIESRPFFSRIPDQTLIVSTSDTQPAHAVATRSSDGAYAMLYLPAGTTEVTINTASLSDNCLNAWWFYPRTGQAIAADLQANSAENPLLLVQTPLSTQDWVLVLDDAARGFSAPGQPDGDTHRM